VLVAVIVAVTLAVQGALVIAYRSLGDAKEAFASTLNQLQRYDVLDRDALVLQRAVVALDGSPATVAEVVSRRAVLAHQIDVVETSAPDYFPEVRAFMPRLTRLLAAFDGDFARYRRALPGERPALAQALTGRLREVDVRTKELADAYADAAFRMERGVLRDHRSLQRALVAASILELALLALFGWRAWRALRRDIADAERRVEQIADAIDEILFTGRLSASQLAVMYVSKPLDALLGAADRESASHSFARLRSLVHLHDREIVAAYESALRRGEAASAEYRVEVPEGTRWILERAHPRPPEHVRRHDGPGTTVVDGVLSDVTSRREAQEAVAKAYADARHQSVTDALTGVHNRHFLHERLRELAAASDVNGAGGPAVLLVDVDHFKRINDEYGHTAGDEVLREIAERIRAVCEPRGHIVGRWGGEEFVVVIPSVASDDDLRAVASATLRAVARDGFTTSAWQLPVTVSIGAARLEKGSSTEALVAAADSALHAAKRRGRNQALLPGDVRESDLAAEGAHVILIAQALALSASISEGMPEEHAWAVASRAASIAEEMGLAPWLVMRCRLGGWLHDVGKVAIPNVVLGKAGQLSEDEMQLVRTHCAIGEQIVLRVPELRDAASAVRHHHEWVDGTGYPDGLAGDEIPIEARIVAAADVYCTITADRGYHTARSHDEALAELSRSAGSHLDPDVVAALVRLLDAERTVPEVEAGSGVEG
jgi:diguanylate cyclase (GGDEF)-like protein